MIRKNIVMICATESTSPKSKNTKVIANVRMEAFIGSLVCSLPLEKKSLILPIGKVLSLQIACNVRGAISIKPSDEDSVAAASPKGMLIYPNKLISDIISG